MENFKNRSATFLGFMAEAKRYHENGDQSGCDVMFVLAENALVRLDDVLLETSEFDDIIAAYQVFFKNTKEKLGWKN